MSIGPTTLTRRLRVAAAIAGVLGIASLCCLVMFYAALLDFWHPCAQPEFVNPALVPFDWYKALVIEGAKYHKFPAAYLAAIEAVPSLADPDSDRAATNWALIEKIRRDNARLSEGKLGSQ